LSRAVRAGFGCSSVGVAVALVLGHATAAHAQLTFAKLGPGVQAQLAADGAADVFVLLREPIVRQRDDLHARRRAITTQRDAVLASVGAADVQVRHRFDVVSAFTARITASGLAQLLAHPAVIGVERPLRGHAALAQSVPQIRADAVHRRGDLGFGATVAVLDSGVDASHPDLAGSIVAEHCFCVARCCPNGAEEQSGAGSAFTTSVHGIHVTGIIVSKGIIAPVGVAPSAKVVAIKVVDDDDDGFLLDWIAALDWIATQRPDVQAVNMSLATTAEYTDPCDNANAQNMALSQVVRALRAHGVLTFAASGNDGQIDRLPAPACISAALAVGAVTKSDIVAYFSNSAPFLDLLAPGVGIVSTGGGHSNDTCVVNGAGPTTSVCSGTSMAAPHATATAALMLAINPSMGATQLESVLKNTGVPIVDTRNGLTYPRIDALAAMNAVLSVTSPLSGGGSGRTDCLVEWAFTPQNIITLRPVEGAVCRDNDADCDDDQAPGQCTFQLSVCFNAPDRRLPRCATDAPITAYELATPPAHGDAIDAANAAAIHAALPPAPITGVNQCSDPIAFVVPTSAPRSIRLAVHAGDGRTDADRLRLTCLPAK